ncbi:TIGR03086 family metal-binding protein [Streptomyces sp. NPDC101151]|uniref:TIGR03086 family metal-binding protein n=1 Tax=Streptomyces sp. NPDC101151 TaxID=3366115 RepID=UPI00383027BC
MGSSVTDLYARIASHFGDLIGACPPDRWERPSPCAGWSAWDVAAHVISNHRRALAGLEGTRFSAPARGEDLLRAWNAASTAVGAALCDPVRARAVLGEEFGSLSFEEFVKRMACADTLIHTWDLARATGQDEALDAEAVALATVMLLPEDADIRSPRAFGAKIASVAGADAQTGLLNFLGRRV